MRKYQSLTGLIHMTMAVSMAVTWNAWAQADNLPSISTGHTDVGVNYEEDGWDLHVHAEDEGLEFEPNAVWIRGSSLSRTTVPSSSAFGFLGSAGSAVWVLPAVQKTGIPFLGFGTEEMASGIFVSNAVQLRLTQVTGPGKLAIYVTDMFGAPVVWYNSGDGLDTNDIHTLLAGGHTHVNWAFTAPGKYHVYFQATGVLASTGQTTTSEPAEYLFDIGDLVQLQMFETNGALRLRWLSETNTAYQIQTTANLAGAAWVDLGNPITGTGDWLSETVSPSENSRFYRILTTYGAGNEPGIVARLFVADATNSVLSTIDLETGVISASQYALNSRATLGSTPDNRYCLAVELDGDKAELFDSGVYVEDHGDHWHYYKEDTSRMTISLLGDNPVHTVAAGDWLTLHWDLTGRVDLFNQNELAVQGNAYVPRVLYAGKQHGSAVPFNDGSHFAISKPNPLYPETVKNPLPVGVDIWDLDASNRVYSVSGFSNMHGEAGNGRSAAFGFTEGVLLLWQTNNAWTHFMITNPAAMPAGYRIGDVRGNKALDVYYGMSFLGEVAGGLFFVDATAHTMKPVELPTDSVPVEYEFTPDGQYFLVVQANGDFVKLNAATGAVVGQKIGVVSATTNFANHGQFEPGIAAGLGRIYISDPAGGRIVELNADTLQTMRTFGLPGSPTKLTLHGVLETPTR
jgi:surface-anchored protein